MVKPKHIIAALAVMLFLETVFLAAVLWQLYRHGKNENEPGVLFSYERKQAEETALERQDEIIKGEFERLRNGDLLELKLPYEIEDDVQFVFHGNIPLAIDIIEMRVDGETLSIVDDFDPGSGWDHYYNITGIGEEKREYFISMVWRWNNRHMAFRWYDGRGIIRAEKSNGYKTYANTYELSPGMNVFEIRYRIVIPYPTVDIYNLIDQKYEYKRFTKEYRMIVDLTNVFDDHNETK
jgi:hypothetical protein